MGMKHPLHRKKLQLALRAFTTKVTEKSSELDHIWVTRKNLLVLKISPTLSSHFRVIYKCKVSDARNQTKKHSV